MGDAMSAIGEWVNAEPGLRRRILTAEGGLMLMEVAFEAGAAGYEHRHPHEQVSYCLRGRFEYTLDGRVNVLSAGDSIYVPGNTLHGARALDAGVLLDVFTPVRDDLLGRD
jgi:quercetin dioxygenase-like cupin family protein